MKGLLLTNWYMSIKYFRTQLIISLVFVIMSMVNEAGAFFLVYPVVVASSMLPTTLLSYEERSKWNIYCDVLPFTRAQYVTSKYIITGLYLGTSLVVIALLLFVRMAITNGVSFAEIFLVLEIMTMVGIFAAALLLPVIFRFGVEKGRYIYFIVIILAFAIFGGMHPMDSLLMYSLFSEVQPLVILGLMMVGIVSWRLSIRFYEKREL